MPVVATNTSANSAIIYLNRNSAAQEKSLAKLSSGSRIVRASDDAAGLAVSTKLQADVNTLKQAATNGVQARSLLQTVDGGLARIGDILQRMKVLAAQANSGSVDATSRGFINTEYQALLTEIDAAVNGTTFNGQNVLNGTFDQNFQVGILSTAIITVNFAGATGVNATTAAAGLNVVGTLVDTVANANTASIRLDTGLNNLSTYRARVGALISRFEYRGDIINTTIDNLDSARSVIQDVDIASEQTNFTSKQVLTETAIAALSQANQLKSSLLSLVR